MMDPRQEIRQGLVPRLREVGFRGSFPHFRRVEGERSELLSFQFDKHGTGKFVIELAVAPKGEFTTYWGATIPEGKLTARDLSERLRLGAAGVDSDHWFELSNDPSKEFDSILAMLRTQGAAFYAGGDP